MMIEETPSDGRAPNILLLTTDQHRHDFVSGGIVPGLQTPTIDRLRREGTTLTQATSVCPICMPARFAWVHGLHPRQAAERLLINWHDWPRGLPTMPRGLQEAGYRTALIGKLHNHAGLQRHDLRADREIIRGFGFHDLVEVAGKSLVHWYDCDWTAYLAERGLLEAHRAHLAQRSDLFGELPPYQPCPLPVQHGVDAFIADHSCRWLEQQTVDRPWFLHASFCGPHFPVDPPEEYAALFRAKNLSE